MNFNEFKLNISNLSCLFFQAVPYIIKTKTGDKRGAGTDANVFIQFYGTEGKSEECQLRTKSDNFERGKVIIFFTKLNACYFLTILNMTLKEDTFKIEADDVGPIYKVRIGHDDKGMSSGWFLEKMHIQRLALKGSKRLRKSKK